MILTDPRSKESGNVGRRIRNRERSDRTQPALYTIEAMPEYRDEHIPLAYLITFRAYGTWLHGDKRGSVNRFHNRFGTALIAPNERWRKYNRSLLTHSPVKPKSRQRALVKEAIRETCKKRKWEFWATNVRSNHVHTVVGAVCKPEKILIAFKAMPPKNCVKLVVGVQVKHLG